MIDLVIGLGLPLLQIPLRESIVLLHFSFLLIVLAEFIVQGHRFDIWEDIGCYPTIVNTPAAYPLSFIWPTIIGLVSAVYCSMYTFLRCLFSAINLAALPVLTLRAFMKRRAQFSEFLSSSTSLTVSRYFRLMSLATVELLFNTPISAYGLYLNATLKPIYPWKSWADIHYDWFTIDIYPAEWWRSSPIQITNLELSRWSLVFCAILFFGFFGFADEARKHYRIAYWAVAKRFGISLPPSPVQGSSKFVICSS